MSESNHVRMTPKDAPELGQQNIICHVPNRCDHVETVCIECVGEWEQDYTIHYRRTRKGRYLMEQRRHDASTLPTSTTPPQAAEAPHGR